MSSYSRIRAVLLAVLGVLACGPTWAQSDPDAQPRQGIEAKSPGNWTDPPAKPASPSTPAAAPQPAATPARIEDKPSPIRAERRSSQRSAKLRRERIRKVAHRFDRPSRIRVAGSTNRRIALSTRSRVTKRVTDKSVYGRELRPIYGEIAPDAPAEAYYARRRLGRTGNGAGSLGLPAGGIDGRRTGGRLLVRWRDPAMAHGAPTLTTGSITDEVWE